VSTGVDAVDLAQLDHLNQQPALKVLFEHRSELRARLVTVEEEGKALRRTLFALRQEDDFQARVSRRETQDKLEDLERKGAALEADLRAVQAEIATTADAVKIELTPLLAADGVPLTEELLNAVQQLADITARYAAFSERTRRLRGSPLVAVPWAIACLPGCVVPIERTLEHLQRLSAP
jgi:hypothetical protein